MAAASAKGAAATHAQRARHQLAVRDPGIDIAAIVVAVIVVAIIIALST